MIIADKLKELTTYVRQTKGPGEALHFYVKHIQPLKEYFEISDSTKENE